MFLTLTTTHIFTLKLNTSKPVDLLSVCIYCMFLGIYILPGSVATY